MFERIEKIAKDACAQHNVSLYDIEQKRAVKGLIIIIFITKIIGVTIDECKKISKSIAEVLEEEDFIDGRYFLEVSSPGLERELKLKKHYLSAIGEKVKITYEKNGKNCAKIGILNEVLPDSITMDFNGETEDISFSWIKRSKTYFDYKKSNKEKL